MPFLQTGSVVCVMAGWHASKDSEGEEDRAGGGWRRRLCEVG